ncbi:MAG: GNAT family N-acetyltransferase [Actinobacteria bacterium]|nr:GNAT family N-acetyltransferase [Actinomycetota bacterium]
MEVRPATADDAAAVAGLLEELGYRTAAGEVRERLARSAADPAAGALVAEAAGCTVALIAYQLIHHLERARPSCRITTLVTAPGHRRRGAAAALLAKVEELARAAGCERLEVTTAPHREDALAFYREAGFVERPRRLVRPLG